MSFILCRQEAVKNPFYVDALRVHIWSSQELCYMIYQYPLLAMDGFVDEGLIQFIEEELGMTFLATRLENWTDSGEDKDELIFLILQECGFYTPKEISAYRQKLSAYRKMSPLEFAKVTADYYFSLRQYGSAIENYEKILDDWKNKAADDDFLGRIWHNIGSSYAGLFWFDKAMQAYEMSWNYRKDRGTLQNMYQLTALNPKLALKERYKILISKRELSQWEADFREAESQARESGEVGQVETMFSRPPKARREEAEKLLGSWKKEYRGMI